MYIYIYKYITCDPTSTVKCYDQIRLKSKITCNNNNNKICIQHIDINLNYFYL